MSKKLVAQGLNGALPRMWRNHALRSHYDVVIIGGGAHGCATCAAGRHSVPGQRVSSTFEIGGRVRGFMKAGQPTVSDYSKARLITAYSRLFGSVPTNRGSLQLRHPYREGN